MKIALIGINNSLLDLSKQREVIDYIKVNIIKQGKQPSLVSYFSNTIDNLRAVLQNNYDLVFCIGTENVIFNHNIKENFARIFGTKLEKNLNAESYFKSSCENKKIVYSTQEDILSYFPTNSLPIFIENDLSNGFMYKLNSTQIIYLPSDILFIKKIYNNFIFSFIRDESLLVKGIESITLRCYGILEKDLRTLLNDELNNPNISINIVSTRLDNILYIKYKSENLNIVQQVIADICNKLSKLIYATEDTSLFETASNLLTIQKKQIVIGETITLGNICMELSKLNSDNIEKGYVFNNFNSIAKQMNLEDKVVNQFGKYSVNTVYELDNLMLQQSTSDIAVFVLGDKNNDLCYIAIGDIDGIHVYKNKLLSYDNSTIDLISETTLFYLIKKLRQNDLQFR